MSTPQREKWDPISLRQFKKSLRMCSDSTSKLLYRSALIYRRSVHLIIKHNTVTTKKKLVSHRKEWYNKFQWNRIWWIRQHFLTTVNMNRQSCDLMESLVTFIDQEIGFNLCRRLFKTVHCNPFYWHGLTLILAWISNHMSCNVWDEITYPFLNFNGATVEV